MATIIELISLTRYSLETPISVFKSFEICPTIFHSPKGLLIFKIKKPHVKRNSLFEKCTGTYRPL